LLEAEERNKANQEMLVRTILDRMTEQREQLAQQFNDRLSILEARPDPPMVQSPKPTYTMTNNHRPLPNVPGRRTPDHDAYQQDRYQPPRADCPGFGGDNIIEWIWRCNSFFEMHQVPEDFKTKLATM
jgi:hypothetical protein